MTKEELIQDNRWWNEIMTALRKNNETLGKKLIDEIGFEITHTRTGLSPVFIVALAGTGELLQYCIDKGATINMESDIDELNNDTLSKLPFYTACWSGNLENIEILNRLTNPSKSLLQQSFSVFLLGHSTVTEKTPYDLYQSLEWFINKSVNPNEENEYGESIFKDFVERKGNNEYLDWIKLMVKNGARISTIDIDLLIRKDKLVIAEYLLDNGGKLNVNL